MKYIVMLIGAIALIVIVGNSFLQNGMANIGGAIAVLVFVLIVIGLWKLGKWKLRSWIHDRCPNCGSAPQRHRICSSCGRVRVHEAA
ncbi:50S ribosomal protein L32 [Diaminobutyricimonas sp. TR449]|uniref:50S ribosomal protein L32 n=1 Tax=Diaminobutyricimonas sp. TR449 TaxID=2708076 RepID=UPI00141D8113|nr:50S ribosomal protein L32 [Diaminobutyricimonas sp. TR449]